MRFRRAGRTMERVLRVWAGLVAASMAAGQTPGPAGVCAGVRPVLDHAAPTRSCSGRVLHEINDPYSGACWLVLQNTGHPAGPGLMIPAADFAAGGTHSSISEKERPIVIHAGDRLVIEEHTAAAEAFLEAVALNQASVGGTLEARLKIGGKVVRAVATVPGRAALMPSRSTQP